MGDVEQEVVTFGIDPNDRTLYHCQSGAKLRLKAVSAVLVERRCTSIPIPQVPIHRWHVEGEDEDRQEPNYTDPDYLNAIKDYNEKISYISTGAYMLFGTEVLELGSGVPECSDESWSRRLSNKATWGESAWDIPPDDEEHHDARYIFWLTQVVLRDIEYKQILSQIQVLGGVVTEEVVATAMRSFRGSEGGDSNSGVGANREQRRNNSRTTRRVRS